LLESLLQPIRRGLIQLEVAVSAARLLFALLGNNDALPAGLLAFCIDLLLQRPPGGIALLGLIQGVGFGRRCGGFAERWRGGLELLKPVHFGQNFVDKFCLFRFACLLQALPVTL
jgi:hypothetical protein